MPSISLYQEFVFLKEGVDLSKFNPKILVLLVTSIDITEALSI
jgi:hypothetical protein